MTQPLENPRVFGRRLAREMTPEEVERVNGAHGESGGGGGTGTTGFTVPDLCFEGVFTGPQCGDGGTTDDIGTG